VARSTVFCLLVWLCMHTASAHWRRSIVSLTRAPDTNDMARVCQRELQRLVRQNAGRRMTSVSAAGHVKNRRRRATHLLASEKPNKEWSVNTACMQPRHCQHHRALKQRILMADAPCTPASARAASPRVPLHCMGECICASGHTLIPTSAAAHLKAVWPCTMVMRSRSTMLRTRGARPRTPGRVVPPNSASLGA
jgi:hypothetical protein